ncbi:glycoside hydrolase family 113 [Hymenobacter koreensis]|uniref:GTA TIM-barrel-like domain-containing protein n=1 Tax=Hymenobacter koreensis TaxID=1084523 RepID=A0ABP8IZ30_9BACT
MLRQSGLLLTLLSLLANRCNPPAEAVTPAASVSPAERLRGVSWVASDSTTEAQILELKRCNVTWITQTPFGWQTDSASPEVILSTGRRRAYWGEADSGLVHTARLARQHGISTMLKPHIWLRTRGQWPGQIQMRTPAEWQQWFASYTAFILHYAKLAEQNRMEALCIGTELRHTSVGHEQQWRQLIKQVRQVYRGKLTYAANWHDEYELIQFWDALDYIGIQAYFPLSKAANPDTATLRRAWQPYVQEIAGVQRRFNRPVIFTEAGYRAIPAAAAAPWEWPNARQPAPIDTAAQAACYEAMFRASWQQPWFAGVFIWKWFPGLRPDSPPRRRADFTPQHQPAEQVMARWYGR